MAYRKIEPLMTLKEPADKSKMVMTLLKGQALNSFEHHLKKRLDAGDTELPDEGLEYIPNRFLGYSMSVHPKQLNQDEIIEILDQKKAPK
jgi:hypothetical protein